MNPKLEAIYQLKASALQTFLKL